MFYCLGFVELNETGARDGVDGIASRIGNKVEVKPGQRHVILAPHAIGHMLWVDRRQTGKTRLSSTAGNFRPRSGSINPTIMNLVITTATIPDQSRKTNLSPPSSRSYRQRPTAELTGEPCIFHSVHKPRQTIRE
jgi:hypothetical protein